MYFLRMCPLSHDAQPPQVLSSGGLGTPYLLSANLGVREFWWLAVLKTANHLVYFPVGKSFLLKGVLEFCVLALFETANTLEYFRMGT